MKSNWKEALLPAAIEGARLMKAVPYSAWDIQVILGISKYMYAESYEALVGGRYGFNLEVVYISLTATY